MARVRPTSPAAEAAPSESSGKAALVAARPKAAGAARRKKPAPVPAAPTGAGVAGQVGLLSGIAASAFTVVALATYDPHDVSLSVAGTGQTENLVGPAGSYLADALYQGFGYASWAVVFVGIGFALRLAGRPSRGLFVKALAAVGFVLLATAIQLVVGERPDAPFLAGGLLGRSTSELIAAQLGRVGAGLTVGTGLLAVATVLFRIDWQPLAARAVERVQVGGPAAVRGVGALGAGAVRASLRAGSAGLDALRDRATAGGEDEDNDNALDEPGTSAGLGPPTGVGRGVGSEPEGVALARRAPITAPRRAPADVSTGLPIRAGTSEPDTAPELPSVWSARRAPPPPPVPVVVDDADRDAPTKVAGRTLVEVEWEKTGALRREEAGSGLPSHLRGATPAPISRPTNPDFESGAPRGAVVAEHRAVAPETGAPRPVVLVPEQLDALDEPPIRKANVEWADAPEAPPRVEHAPETAPEPRIVRPAERDAAQRVACPPEAAGAPEVAPGAAFEPPSSPVPATAGSVEAQPMSRSPELEWARPAPESAQDAEVEADDDEGCGEELPVRSAVPSGPARVAPTGRRPRPSGDGVTVLPGNLKSGGAGDDGRAVRKASTPFQLPPLSLLDDHPPIVAGTDESHLHDMARRLTETLRDFQVDGRVTAIRPGPVITMFEYEPAAGVKLSRIANLSDNLKMALKAISVRIVAPLPGRGCVGIEIPNEKRQTVWARDVFASTEFKTVERNLPMILGKDTEGRPFVTDLAKMPHLLVGGTTGSGKSVGVNSMLVSMLFMRSPEELRMILIDPKMLEFALYEDIPHLLHPVVTEPKFASAVLKWACTEMDERYKIMARWQTRHIDTYNQKVEKELQDWTPAKARAYAPKDWPEGELLPYPKKFPYIVIVIDELADLMMVASSDVEASISRIVAKARAAGIHLIVATQTPRRDVITGLIKANMPASLAYQVRSALDSRVILDQNGAEGLLGKGDLLFLRPGTSDLVRIHGPFLSEDEVHRVADFLRSQGTPEYDLRIGSGSGDDGEDGEGEAAEYDSLYDEAVELAIQKGKVSTSMLQRHLGIGYNRAANIVDTMEREGVVGPADGARPREVLVGQG